MNPPIPDLSACSWKEKKAILEAWVARMNADKEGKLSPEAERWVAQQLQRLDAEGKGSVDSALGRDVDNWLETAGDVGGPEQEQDPARPHPRGWHGNAEEK